MTYHVRVTPSAEKDRQRLEPAIRKRIDSALRSLAGNPRSRGSHKLRASRVDWRLRVGDYRILYEIDDEERTIIVWRIAHRREAYR
jgi:mRNA interferase RelE/StbE